MKRFIYSIFLFSLVFNGYAQCEPDTNCIDVAEPGQICPDTLSSGETGITYYEVITIIPPDSADLGNQSIPLTRIVIDTVTNMPPGLTYIAAKTTLFPDSSYCIEITGVPEQTGTYYLKISVIPYTYSSVLSAEVALPVQTDSTSLFITIGDASLIRNVGANPLQVEIKPNPFRNETLLGVQLKGYGDIRLAVYNLIGKHVYSELKEGIEGKNFFTFTGRDLSPGIYLYNISFKGHRQTGKLLKIK
ncbi:MAG: T9SS type A sorting domain-containing protein [Chlorobi bacterium]|nr:T9SS type A sorting domain-containing protein [Chlorobiota bacterium]